MLTYITLNGLLGACGAYALLTDSVNTGSSSAAWSFLESDSIAEEAAIDEETLLDAIETLLRTTEATRSARALRTAHLKVSENETLNDPPFFVADPPTDGPRSKRWIRDSKGKADYLFQRSQGVLGDLGEQPPPTDLIEHLVSKNVQFKRMGQTAASVGFSHVLMDMSTVELVRFIDRYQDAIRTAAREHEICSVRSMFSNNSAAGSFSCEPHKVSSLTLTAHMQLSTHFHAYVAFRARTQALRDAFRPLGTLNSDFLEGRGPNAHWMDDLKMSLKDFFRVERWVVTTLVASLAGSALINFLWGYFSPSESINAAHIATVAAQTVAHGESLEDTFSILDEATVAIDALNGAVSRSSRLEEVLTRLDFAKSAIERRLDLFQDILDSAAKGKLSSAAFNLFDLRSVANELTNKAAAMHMVPVATSFAELLQADISLFQEDYGFSLVMHIPLIRTDTEGRLALMDIYELSDLPISLSPSLELRVAPRDKRLLAISPKTGEWRTMSPADLYSCSKLSTFYLCPMTGVLRRPLEDKRTQSLDDDACVYHLWKGHFRGASSTCDSVVGEKTLGVTQTGPFTFTAFAPPQDPVIGVAYCPHDPSFQRTLLVSNLTKFSLPPSCEMELGTFKLYSSDRSFIRKGEGTTFTYPFPDDLLGGNLTQSEMDSVKSSLTVARTLVRESRLENWKRSRRMTTMVTDVGYEAKVAMILTGLNHILLFCLAAFTIIKLTNHERRISLAEEETAPPRAPTPLPPSRRAISTFAHALTKRRRTSPPQSVFTPVPRPHEMDSPETQPLTSSSPGPSGNKPVYDTGASLSIYPELAPPKPPRAASSPIAFSFTNGRATEETSDGHRAAAADASSPPPPAYLTVGSTGKR